MPDEWACDDCGYIAGSEPDAGRCPGCGSKMTKIEGVDDERKNVDSYDDDDLATPIDEDDDEIWAELKDIEEEETAKQGK